MSWVDFCLSSSGAQAYNPPPLSDNSKSHGGARRETAGCLRRRQALARRAVCVSSSRQSTAAPVAVHGRARCCALKNTSQTPGVLENETGLLSCP